MRVVKCVHALRCYRVHKVDPKTNKELPREWWNFCNCWLLGDGQEIGVECGKGHCDSYKKETEK